MADKNSESDEENDSNQYGGGSEDIDAVDQTEMREEEVEAPDEDESEGESDDADAQE